MRSELAAETPEPARSEPSVKRLRVVLADDHRRVRAGLRLVLEAEPDFEIVGEADDGLTALQLARQQQPDVLLLDQDMPGMRGLDVAKTMLRERPELRVVMFTFDETIRSLAAASGVSAFLTKDATPSRLASTLRYVASGAPAAVAPSPAAPVSIGPTVDESPAIAEVRRPQVRVAEVVLAALAAAAFPLYAAIRVALGAAVDTADLAAVIVLGSLLAAYAIRTAAEVHRASAENEAKGRFLAQLTRVGALARRPLELTDLAERLLGELRSTVGSEATATLLLYDAGLRTFEPLAEVGPNAGAFKRDVYPLVFLPHEIYQNLVVQQRTWRVQDTEPASDTWRVLTNFFPRIRARTVCAVPLRAGGLALGAILVRDPRPGAITDEAAAQLERLASFLAAGVQAATLRFESKEAKPAAE